LQNRVGLTEEQARARIRSQLPAKEKARYADAIINTNCSVPEVSVRVLELWGKLQKKGK
jgi:dephospho-CoA kinase